MEVEIQNGMLWRREGGSFRQSPVGDGVGGSPLPLGLVAAVSFPVPLVPPAGLDAADVLAVSIDVVVVVGIGVVVGAGGVKRRPV
jgi:hypothetical protein